MPKMGSGVVLEVVAVLQDVTREQSTETAAVVGPRKDTTLVVGQTNSKVTGTVALHVVATAMAGVLNVIVVVAGQDIVMAPVEAGNVKVVTVALGTVTGMPMGV